MSITLHNCCPCDNSSNGCLELHLVQANKAADWAEFVTVVPAFDIFTDNFHNGKCSIQNKMVIRLIIYLDINQNSDY